MERIYDYIDVLQWLLEVARGLRYLHSRSLTHRSGSDLGRCPAWQMAHLCVQQDSV